MVQLVDTVSVRPQLPFAVHGRFKKDHNHTIVLFNMVMSLNLLHDIDGFEANILKAKVLYKSILKQNSSIFSILCTFVY